MNIFSSFLKKRISEAKMDTVMDGSYGKENGPVIVYLGNGASAQCFAELFRRKRLCGNEMEPGSGSNRYAAFQLMSKKHESSVLVNGFFHKDAEFAGFCARMRENDTWSWYTVDKKWEKLSPEMAPKYIFQEGDDVRDILKDDMNTVFMQAQWKDKKTGKLINCGYPMFSNQLMAHAFGGFEGKTYCNTVAAFENSIRNGYRYFEVDLSYTSDGRLVLCHGWSKGNCKHTGFEYSPDFSYMPYDRIMNMKVHGHEIIDAKAFYQIVKQYPEYTFEIDFHNIQGEEIKNRIRALLEDFRNDTEALDRLLIQAYSAQMYLDMDEVYHFKHYQYLVGKNISNLDEIITFCVDHGICVLAMRDNLAKPSFVNKIKNAGLYVMCYTVNSDISVALKLLESGVDTLCTDFITPVQIEEGKNKFGRVPFFVYYNSGSTETMETYTDLIESNVLKGIVATTPKGALEFKDQVKWKNTGKKKLISNRFSVPGKQFAGWKLRVRIDEKQLWYCTDHCYHTGGDITEESTVRPYLFGDGEILPVWTVKENMKLVMVAVWE